MHSKVTPHPSARQPLRVLMIEDNPCDGELVLIELQRAAYDPQCRRVETEADFLAHLGDGFDIVLSDYRLPTFTGLRALELLRQRDIEIPFILISGTIGEEAAVEAMRQGATDYVLKDRLARLGQSVRHALEGSRLRAEHRRVEQMIRENAAAMETAQEIGRFGSWELDLASLPESQRRPLRWSAQCFRIFGFEPGEVEVTNELFFSLVHPDDRESIREAVGEAIRQGSRYLLDHRIVLRCGEVRHVREAGRVVFDTDTRRPLKLAGSVHDLTDERRAHAELRKAHAQLNHLVARSPTVIYQLKPRQGDFHPHFFSENVPALSGYTVEESCSPSWWSEHVHPDDLGLAREGLRAALTEGASRVEYRIRCRDGAYIWLEDRKRLLPSADGGPWEVVGGWTDITARKQAEETVRELGDRFRQLVETIHEVFWIMDVAAERYIYVSPAYEKIWGRTAESLYADPASWMDIVHAEDRPRVRRALPALLAGTYEETYRITGPDGTKRWIHAKAFPVKDPTGRVTRVVGLAEDITQRKQLEEQFLRAQRLEAIGTLAGGIAHDLNNILAPILMVAPLLKRAEHDAHEIELLNMVEQGAQRGANIIRQLLTFSRGIDGERGPVQVRHLLREMVAIVRETFPREIAVHEKVPVNLWPITADATQIHQVLMNLCVNARDAMGHTGQLTLEAENMTVEQIDTQRFPLARPGRFIRIAVSDTGHGIPRENLDRIFEPFFTTKEFGKGTGLGLSTVLGIVKSHEGFLTVQSNVGQGSTFAVHLPALQGDAEAGRPSVSANVRGAQELILVVDDEEPIRHTLRLTLEARNYRVLLAADGREGVSAFMANREHIRLVLTDVMMPGMSGVAMIRAIRALAPRVPIIAASGLDDQDRRDELDALSVTTVLAKPCGPEDLLQAVRRELAEE